jgi:hypothetical protein
LEGRFWVVVRITGMQEQGRELKELGMHWDDGCKGWGLEGDLRVE